MENPVKWKHLFLAALLFFLLDALVFGADDLRLRVYPRMGLAPLRNVLLMVEIKDPEKFWCPAVEVTWWEGNTSAWEADCDPLEEGEKPEDFYQSFRLGENYAFISDQEIVVVIKQGKHQMRNTIKLTVSGG